MVRYSMEKPPLVISYGCDNDSKGIYLSVCDQRLMFDATTLDEVNNVIERFDSSKNGAYLKLCTGSASSDFGMKVSVDTISTYLRRYRVPREHISELIAENSKPTKPNVTESKPAESKPAESKRVDVEKPIQPCVTCKTPASSRCQRCRQAYYCAKECQVSDWIAHKFFCASLPFPPAVNAQRSVQGVFFADWETKPTLVRVPLVPAIVDETLFYIPDHKLYLKDTPGIAEMRINPLKGKRALANTIQFFFRDNFFNDGSTPNKCIAHLTGGKNNHDWRGPVLAIKLDNAGCPVYQSYLDIQVEDFVDIRDFFFCYYDICTL